jgi:hypothetical protein
MAQREYGNAAGNRDGEVAETGKHRARSGQNPIRSWSQQLHGIEPGLQQTEAAIGNANARSQYNFAISTINFQTGVQP